MAGHSHWTQIKHQKARTDAQRGRLFTKLTREILVAVREGGPNPDANPRLRMAIEKAREHNMPMENIERAIRRASGQGDGESSQLEEILYEAYGPGGVAILIRAVTDNRNRAASEVRHTLEKHGGKLAGAGSVAWQFSLKGVISVEEPDPQKAEEVALLAIDLGAEDFSLDGSYLEIRTPPERFEEVRRGLAEQGVRIASAEVSLVSSSPVPLDERTAEQVLRLLDRLEDLDDVQKVYTNADFPAQVLERYRVAA